mmetsp:Transcript_136447/g.272132  ORF Transcript_136447/g.272132 Transcript_136447/m.272132 type:complete len:240 (+) Transcript_136447:660-1379(+)
MHAIVADIWLGLESKILPVGENLAAQGILRSFCRICGAKDFAAEIGPREIGGIPFHRVIVDLSARHGKLGPHGHEETIEDVQRLLAINLHKPTIETASELDQLLCCLALRPFSIHLVGIDIQLCASVHCIKDLARCQGILPGETELSLKFVFRHVQLIGLQNCCFGGNSVIVLVDQLFLVDNLTLDASLLQDLDAILFQTFLCKRLHLICDCMWLDEDKGIVLLVQFQLRIGTDKLEVL